MNSSEKLYLYGLHAVTAALANPRRKIHSLLISLPTDHPNRIKLQAILDEHDNPPHVSETVRAHLDKLVGSEAVHQGIVAYAKPQANFDLRDFLVNECDEMPPVAILDQVTDPHNIGAILRSAAAFGIGALITTARNSPDESGLIGRISSGGLEVVPWLRVRNLGQACETLRELGYHLSGFAAEAEENLTADSFKEAALHALVLGSEGSGLREKTRGLCHKLVKLPTVPPVSDINVSNAAAISFYALAQSWD